VSPGCHVPADRRQRMGESAGAAAAVFRAIFTGLSAGPKPRALLYRLSLLGFVPSPSLAPVR
jgi:hypothetical protein